MSIENRQPRSYNAARDLLTRNTINAQKIAYVDASTGEQMLYGELEQKAWRFAHVLRTQGILPESRIMLCMLDTLNWPVVFFRVHACGSDSRSHQHLVDHARF